MLCVDHDCASRVMKNLEKIILITGFTQVHDVIMKGEKKCLGHTKCSEGSWHQNNDGNTGTLSTVP